MSNIFIYLFIFIFILFFYLFISIYVEQEQHLESNNWKEESWVRSEVIVWENMNFTCNNHEDLLGGGRWAYKACPTTDTHTNRMFLLVDCHIWHSITLKWKKSICSWFIMHWNVLEIAWKWECQSVWRWGINSMHVYYPLWVPQLHHYKGLVSTRGGWVENRYGTTKRLCVC
jgi:hypothetical protein